MGYTRTIEFVTASANQDLLQVTSVKNAIKEALGLDDTAYTARTTPNTVNGTRMGFVMTFDIIANGDNTLKINGNTSLQTLINSRAYSNTSKATIWSIILGSAGAGQIVMDIYR